jgi:hypothetical protein
MAAVAPRGVQSSWSVTKARPPRTPTIVCFSGSASRAVVPLSRSQWVSPVKKVIARLRKWWNRVPSS